MIYFVACCFSRLWSMSARSFHRRRLGAHGPGAMEDEAATDHLNSTGQMASTNITSAWPTANGAHWLRAGVGSWMHENKSTNPTQEPRKANGSKCRAN